MGKNISKKQKKVDGKKYKQETEKSDLQGCYSPTPLTGGIQPHRWCRDK